MTKNIKSKFGLVALLLILLTLVLAACGNVKSETKANNETAIFKPAIWFGQEKLQAKETLTINGQGFSPITRLQVNGGVNFANTTHGAVTTDINGNFSVEIRLDLADITSNQPYEYLISVATRDNELKAGATITVVP
jgi:hypothetical protein